MTWTAYKLDELGFVSRGRSRHRPRDAAHLYEGPYPFVQTGDVKHAGLFLTGYQQTYSDAGLAQSKLWPSGTLCITIAANIADTAILAIDACFPDSVIGFIPNPEKADARFIKYLFDATLKKRFKKFTQGATQDNLSQEKLLSLDLLVPEVSEQARIADILAKHDELIETNCRRIYLLEETIRLLYREWFIHLRFPGHEHAAKDDGVPYGWKSVPLKSICTDIRDSIVPSQVEHNTPYIGLEHMPRRSITLSEWGHAGDVESNKFRYIEGDILFGKIRPYFHKVGFTFTDGICSSDAIVIRAHEKDTMPYVLALVSSDNFVAIASKTAKEGSKMPRADWKFMQQHQVLLPSKSILLSFRDTTQPILQQLKALALQNQKLAQARDLLLPRLMNGEVTV